MFSNKDIVQDDADFEGKNIKDLMVGKIPFAERIISTPSMLMFITFFIMICIYIGSCIKSGCSCCKTIKQQGKKLWEQLSYKQLMEEYIKTKAELEFLTKGKVILRLKLKCKLIDINNVLKNYFMKYKKEVDLELTEDVLKDFYNEYESVLNKTSLQGLASYRI